MTREEVIAGLVDFAGPLGPFESFDEHLRRRDQWVDVGDLALLDRLLELAAVPPDDREIAPVNRENLELEISEMLARIGRRHPEETLNKLRAHWNGDIAKRPILIDVLASIGRGEGVDMIAPLAVKTELDEDVLVRIAGALGEIGGPRAGSLLRQMRAVHPRTMAKLHREIDVAESQLEQ